MLGSGANAVIHYTPTVIASSLHGGSGGAVVLMDPSSSALITAVSGTGDDESEHKHQAGQQEASSGNDAEHSPIHLPSTAVLNTHISKSVYKNNTLHNSIKVQLAVVNPTSRLV